jgi:hypothetical protein
MVKIHVTLREAAEGYKLELELPAEVLALLQQGKSVQVSPDDSDDVQVEVEGIDNFAELRINWP